MESNRMSNIAATFCVYNNTLETTNAFIQRLYPLDDGNHTKRVFVLGEESGRSISGSSACQTVQSTIHFLYDAHQGHIRWTSTIFITSLLCILMYKNLLRYLRRKAWDASITRRPTIATAADSPTTNDGKFHLLADIQEQRSSPTFGGVSWIESLYMYLNQYPIYGLMLVKTFILLPAYFFRMVMSKVLYGRYGNQSEKDVVDFLVGTPGLYIICKPVKNYSKQQPGEEQHHESDLLEFTLPKDLPGEPHSGGNYELNDFSIVFDPQQRRVVHATYHGRVLDPKTSSNFIFSLVVSAINTWTHFKSHLMAEVSAQEIIHGRIQALEPSARFVLGLHSGLLNAPLSPAVSTSPLNSLSVSRQSFEGRFQTPMPHFIHRSKFQFLGFQFCWAARKALATQLEHHGLSKHVNMEPLFQNLILHSIDHFLGHRHLQTLGPFSLDGSESFYSYIQSHLWVSFWMPPKVNPLDDMRLSVLVQYRDTHPFYQDLYNDLKRADPFLADQIIVSTCF